MIHITRELLKRYSNIKEWVILEKKIPSFEIKENLEHDD